MQPRLHRRETARDQAIQTHNYEIKDTRFPSILKSDTGATLKLAPNLQSDLHKYRNKHLNRLH